MQPNDLLGMMPQYHSQVHGMINLERKNMASQVMFASIISLMKQVSIYRLSGIPLHECDGQEQYMNF